MQTMEFLLKSCQNCHNPMNGGIYRAAHICPHCLFEHEGGRSRKKRRKDVAQAASYTETSEQNVESADSQYDEQEYVNQPYAVEPEAAEAAEETPEAEERQGEEQQEITATAKSDSPAPKTPAVTLTTKPATDHSIVADVGEVSAECVLNLKVTADMIENGKFVGAKNPKVKAALEQGKKHVLSQLRQKAHEQGANLVANITMKNVVKTADTQNVKMLVQATGLAV